MNKLLVLFHKKIFLLILALTCFLMAFIVYDIEKTSYVIDSLLELVLNKKPMAQEFKYEKSRNTCNKLTIKHSGYYKLYIKYKIHEENDNKLILDHLHELLGYTHNININSNYKYGKDLNIVWHLIDLKENVYKNKYNANNYVNKNRYKIIINYKISKKQLDYIYIKKGDYTFCYDIYDDENYFSHGNTSFEFEADKYDNEIFEFIKNTKESIPWILVTTRYINTIFFVFIGTVLLIKAIKKR